MNCPWCNSSDLRDYNETGGSIYCNKCGLITNKDFLPKEPCENLKAVENDLNKIGFLDFLDIATQMLQIVRRAADNSCCICCDSCLACDALKLLRKIEGKKAKMTKHKKPELLPCPFCGFSHSLSPRSNQWQNGLWVYQWGRCGANSPPTSIKDELNKIWNTRYDQPKELCQEGKLAGSGMGLYDAWCKQCENFHPQWKYPCNCEFGKIAVEPLGYKTCEICNGRGYLNDPAK